jgi:DNA gyrase subunit B
LGIAGDRAKVRTSSVELAHDELRRVLERVIQYQRRLEKLVQRRDPRVIDAVVQASAITAETLRDRTRLDRELERIGEYFESRYPDILDQLKVLVENDPEHHAKKLVFRSEVNGSPRETVVDMGFLTGPEYRELLAMREVFSGLGPAPYTVVLEDGEVRTYTVQEMLKAVQEDARKGLGIQRYKGLGEMNPEQLWETTMDPSRRTLLQVRVEDAVESDEIFSLLMGEAVEPRREFIERNALEVQNLDI